MLPTAPVWRGATALRRCAAFRKQQGKGCSGLAPGGTEDGFSLASETTGVSGLAERYAAALFDLADERHALDEVATDLRQLRAMLQQSGDFQRLIRSPILSRDQQGTAMKAIVERAGLSPVVRDFLAVVARNRRLFAVLAMIEAFLKRKYRGKDLGALLKEQKELASAFRKLRGGGFSTGNSIKVLKRHAADAERLEEMGEEE